MQGKIARNHALLDRIIAQQSTAQAEKSGGVLDDLGIMDGALPNKPRRAPPRRAVTWVNEVRCGDEYCSMKA